MFDAELYRTKEEVAQWKKKDPIQRFEKYLTEKGILKPEKKEGIISEIETEIKAAVGIVTADPELPLEFKISAGCIGIDMAHPPFSHQNPVLYGPFSFPANEPPAQVFSVKKGYPFGFCIQSTCRVC